jgi:hypothetical protein
LELEEFVLWGWCYGDCGVEGVRKRGVVGTEGQFADDVGEVECCDILATTPHAERQRCVSEFWKDLQEWSRCSPNSIYPCPRAVM